MGQGLLIFEAPRLHSDTPRSVGLLWASDEPHAEISTLTTHNTHNRETFMHQAGFEPAIPTFDRSQTHALEGADTGISVSYKVHYG